MAGKSTEELGSPKPASMTSGRLLKIHRKCIVFLKRNRFNLRLKDCVVWGEFLAFKYVFFVLFYSNLNIILVCTLGVPIAGQKR